MAGVVLVVGEWNFGNITAAAANSNNHHRSTTTTIKGQGPAIGQ